MPVKAVIEDRLKHPIIGTFVLSYAALHYKLIIKVLSLSVDTQSKIDIIKETNFLNPDTLLTAAKITFLWVLFTIVGDFLSGLTSGFRATVFNFSKDLTQFYRSRDDIVKKAQMYDAIRHDLANHFKIINAESSNAREVFRRYSTQQFSQMLSGVNLEGVQNSAVHNTFQEIHRILNDSVNDSIAKICEINTILEATPNNEIKTTKK